MSSASALKSGKDIIADNGSQAHRPRLWSMLHDFLTGVHFHCLVIGSCVNHAGFSMDVRGQPCLHRPWSHSGAIDLCILLSIHPINVSIYSKLFGDTLISTTCNQCSHLVKRVALQATQRAGPLTTAHPPTTCCLPRMLVTIKPDGEHCAVGHY